MSHFSVAVISQKVEDVTKLLKPFDENNEVKFIDTNKEIINDITQKRVDITDIPSNIQNYILSFLLNKKEDNLKNDIIMDKIDLYIHKYWGYTSYSKEHENRYGYWYNENSKWDWYQIGGRWSNLLTTNKGKVNQALLKDVIFDVSDEATVEELTEVWNLATKNENTLTKEEKNRKIELGIFYKSEYYNKRYGTKEQFIKENTSFSTYAVVTPDGKWHEPGEMGWFGVSFAEAESSRNFVNNYYDNFIKPYLESDENYYITIVDCHI